MAGRGVATADRLAAKMTFDRHRRYDPLIGAIIDQARGFARDGVPAADTARIIADAITSPRPRTRYTIGHDAAIITRLARLAQQAELMPVRSGLSTSRGQPHSSALSSRPSPAATPSDRAPSGDAPTDRLRPQRQVAGHVRLKLPRGSFGLVRPTDGRAPGAVGRATNGTEAVHLTGGKRAAASLDAERDGSVMRVGRRRLGIGRQYVVDDGHQSLEALLGSLEHMFASVGSRPDGTARTQAPRWPGDVNLQTGWGTTPAIVASGISAA